MSQSGTGAAAQPMLTSATVVAPTSGFGSPTTTTTIDANGNVNWVGGAWYVPLPVAAGDVIGTVTVVVRDNGPNNGHSLDGNNVIANLISRTAAGDTSRAFASSNGSGSQQTLTLAPSGGYTVQVGDEMLLEMHGLKGGANPGPSTVPSMTGATMASPKETILAGTTINIPVTPDPMGAAAGLPVVSAPVLNFGSTNGIGYHVYGVPMGSTVVQAGAVLSDTPGYTVTVSLAAKTASLTSSSQWQVVGSRRSNGSGALQRIDISGLAFAVPDMTELALDITPNGASVTATMVAAEITYQ